jgi:hypothetical protein
MKQYSGWQALFLSFWSSDLYRDVARNWQGVGYLYLLLVVSLSVFFLAAQVQIVAAPKAQEIIDSIIDQTPNIKIEKGKLSIDKPSPFVIKEPKSGKALITFDTQDKPMTLEESKSVVLVTSRSVIAQKRSALRSEGSTGKGGAPIGEETYDLSTVDSFVFDKAAVEGMVHAFLKWLGVLLFVIWVPFAFVFSILQTLLYALIGRLFASNMSIELTYGTLVRLAVIALTPVLLLDSVLKVAGVNPPFWGLCCVVLALGYLYFGVYANSQDKMPGSPPGTNF